MAPHQPRLLWTALLLICSANADPAAAADGQHSSEGGVRRRRPRRSRQHNDRHLGHFRRPDPNAPLDSYGRQLSSGEECTANEQPFKLTFQTDSYGEETSWFLQRTSSSSSEYIGYGPPTGISYGDFTIYSVSYCLSIGSTYTLAMEDNFGDGMCCSRGHGGYEYSIGGVRIYSTNLLETFRDYVEHTFTVQGEYSPAPTPAPTDEGEGDGTTKPEAPPMACVSNPAECGCDNIQQEDYRGSISTTENGIPCQAWDTQIPHTHTYTSEIYPTMDLANHNHCRSPDGGWPWCYTSDPNVQWGYCRIPSCSMEVTDATTLVLPTYYPTEMPSPTDGRPTRSPVKGPTVSPSLSPSKSPTPPPTLPPTPKPTPDRSVQNPTTGCYGGDVHIKIDVRADLYSTDTSWDLWSPNGTKLLFAAEGSFATAMEFQTREICVPHGNYTFTIRDKYGDGMCCRYGEGFFKVYLDGREVLNGGSYNEDVSVQLAVGYSPDGYMTQREFDYLEAHNYRRKEWHERYNLTYVPLVYSPHLAADSKAWADELLNQCGILGIEHEDQNPFGENLASNTGNPATWGQLYPAENIVRRWVDFEIGLAYPSNGHLTQALWRASKYLGCGESVKPFRNGYCRMQVCRYGRAGNCDMSRFNSTQGENWLVPMLDNYTRCGPDCPGEGCF